MQCVEWLGGVGFTKEFPVEKFYRDAKIGEWENSELGVQPTNSPWLLVDSKKRHIKGRGCVIFPSVTVN